MLKYKKIELR